jgi:hypothetical protein
VGFFSWGFWVFLGGFLGEFFWVGFLLPTLPVELDGRPVVLGKDASRVRVHQDFLFVDPDRAAHHKVPSEE